MSDTANSRYLPSLLCPYCSKIVPVLNLPPFGGLRLFRSQWLTAFFYAFVPKSYGKISMTGRLVLNYFSSCSKTWAISPLWRVWSFQTWRHCFSGSRIVPKWQQNGSKMRFFIVVPEFGEFPLSVTSLFLFHIVPKLFQYWIWLPSEGFGCSDRSGWPLSYSFVPKFYDKISITGRWVFNCFSSCSKNLGNFSSSTCLVLSNMTSLFQLFQNGTEMTAKRFQNAIVPSLMALIVFKFQLFIQTVSNL